MPAINIVMFWDMDQEWISHLLPVTSKADVLVETQLLMRPSAQHNLVNLPPLTLQLAEKPPLLKILMCSKAEGKRMFILGKPNIHWAKCIHLIVIEQACASSVSMEKLTPSSIKHTFSDIPGHSHGKTWLCSRYDLTPMIQHTPLPVPSLNRVKWYVVVLLQIFFPLHGFG